MFGPGSRALLLSSALFLVFAAPTRAFARDQTFYTGTPFGIGLVGGLESTPSSSMLRSPQTYSSSTTKTFALEPFFDLGNVCFRAHVGWHFFPILNGTGGDGSGNFTENSNAGALDYGGRIEFAPVISGDARSRFYFVVGFYDSVVKIKSERTYTSGTKDGQTFTDQVQGSGSSFNGGIGFETFLVQNWSIAFEAGYASLKGGTFTYGGSTDLGNNQVTSSSAVLDASGGNLNFHSFTPYGQVVLNLNL